MNKKKVLVIIIGFALLLISIVFWKFFIPRKDQDLLSEQIKFWKTQQSTFETGFIETNNTSVKWRTYKNGGKTKIEAMVYHFEEEINFSYFQDGNHQWIYYSEADKYILLPEVPEIMDESFFYTMILSHISEKMSEIKISEKKGLQIYQWKLTKEDILLVIDDVFEDNINLESNSILSLYIQSYLIRKRILADKKEIEKYTRNQYSNEVLKDDELWGNITIIPHKEKLSVELTIVVNQQEINFRQDTELYYENIQINPMEEDKLVPIEEFLLFQ